MDRATKRRQKHEAKQRKKEERAQRKANRKPSVLLKELWNLPNMLTMGRIAVIPLFVWFTYAADPFYSLCAAALFAIASINAVGKVLIYASTFFSVWSAGGYFKAFFTTLGAHPRNT